MRGRDRVSSMLTLRDVIPFAIRRGGLARQALIVVVVKSFANVKYFLRGRKPNLA
jgi:hypothetical protein